LNQYSLICDPYKEDNCMQPAPPEVTNSDAVCAYKYADDNCNEYSILNYPSKKAAEADGAFVTHYGNCGACSNAQDLAVYMNHFDMTTPARRCAFMNVYYGEEAMLQCYADMGMTDTCA
jgi:hypothetical protein